MAITETRVAAYITGASFAPNQSETVDVSVAQDRSEMETRYFCTISAVFETQYDNGAFRPESVSVNVRLTDSVSGLDYKLDRWSVQDIAVALPSAVCAASREGKERFAGFSPDYPIYAVEAK